MVLLTPAVYTFLGFSAGLLSNSIRKLPLMRRPWEHLMLAGTGYYLGTHVELARGIMKDRLAESENFIQKQREEREAKFQAYEAAKKADEKQAA